LTVIKAERLIILGSKSLTVLNRSVTNNI
jgi:hypothetical protein